MEDRVYFPGPEHLPARCVRRRTEQLHHHRTQSRTSRVCLVGTPQ